MGAMAFIPDSAGNDPGTPVFQAELPREQRQTKEHISAEEEQSEVDMLLHAAQTPNLFQRRGVDGHGREYGLAAMESRQVDDEDHAVPFQYGPMADVPRDESQSWGAPRMEGAAAASEAAGSRWQASYY